MAIRMLRRIVDRALNPDGSVSIDDPEIIKAFTNIPDFPYLVSFPRTGSHWLRMLMELYFEKPALVRAFYYKDAKVYTCYHTHDLDLSVARKNVIYLYRDPVETVYSQLRYHKESMTDEDRIGHWSALYGLHLSKWLRREVTTSKKTIVTYEGLKTSAHQEFQKICKHFDAVFDSHRFDEVRQKVSKEELRTKTKHDQQVVNLAQDYCDRRELFRLKYGTLVMDRVFAADRHLRSSFY